ncbi:SUZ RNA-binding domain-containing-like [Watersipora subatra]|uniref:SUZ RNA-binding domain-containing-like n=1 Tax=Watersipora subatra TaxID=2589382 RepID=UPI00355B5FDB
MANCESDDDWETLDETGELDRQINALNRKTTVKVATEEMDPLQFGKVTIMQNNEPHRTPYVPTIKLLKRDPKNNTVSQEGMGDRKPSYKTLKQREAEYAEARKRILGDHSDSTSDPVEILSSSDTSPTLAPRMHVTTERREPVVSRQPLPPNTSSNGFKPRTKSIDSTS